MEEITFEELKERYSHLKLDELITLQSKGLTDIAKKALKEELKERNYSENQKVIQEEIIEKNPNVNKEKSNEKMDKSDTNKITIGFNITFSILYFIGKGSSERFSNQTSGFEPKDPFIYAIFALIFMIIGLFITQFIVKEVWNRLLADLFKTRKIDGVEAYAIMLLFAYLL